MYKLKCDSKNCMAEAEYKVISLDLNLCDYHLKISGFAKSKSVIIL